MSTPSPTQVRTDVLARMRLPGSPRQLATVRIALGLYLIGVFSSGVIPLLFAIPASAYPGTRSVFPVFVERFAAEHLVMPALTVGLVGAAAMAAGFLTRVAVPVTLAAYVVTQNFYYRMLTAHDDWVYFTFFLLVLCFAPCADVWSVDARLRRRPLGAPQSYRWPVELMGAWLALAYVAAGLAKVFPLRKGIVWIQGYSLQGMVANEIHESGIHWVLGHTLFDYNITWPFVVMSAATVVLELSAFSVLLTRRAVPWVALAIISLHSGIAMFGITGFLTIFLIAGITWIEPRLFRDVAAAPAATA